MTPACSADLAGLCETLATVLGASRGRFRRPFPPAHLLAEGLGIRASQILSAGREGVVLTGTIPPELTRLQDGYCEGRTRCLHKPSRSSVRGEHAGEGLWQVVRCLHDGRPPLPALPHEAWWLLCKRAGESRPLLFSDLGQYSEIRKRKHVAQTAGYKVAVEAGRQISAFPEGEGSRSS